MILPFESILGILVKFLPKWRILEIAWATGNNWHNTLNIYIIIPELTAPLSRRQKTLQYLDGNLSLNLTENTRK